MSFTNDYQDCMMHTHTNGKEISISWSPVFQRCANGTVILSLFSLSLWDQSLGESFCPFLSFWALIIVFPLMLSKAHINCVPLSVLFLSLSTALSVDDGPPLPCMKLKVTVSSKYSSRFLFLFFFFFS